MNAENGKNQAMRESPLSWGAILAVSALVLVSVGGLIYFFVVSTP